MIMVLTGPNSYALQRELHARIDIFMTEQGVDADTSQDMLLERLDGEEAPYERIQEALQSLPFLVSKKLVILQSPGANKTFTEKADSLLKELPETTDLIVVEPKLDKRLGYYKFLKKQPGFQEFVELDETGLARWLSDEAKLRGVRLTTGDARYLVERVGTNQQYLSNELEKLTLAARAEAERDGAKGQPDLHRTTIENLTASTPQSTIFQLLEAAFAGNTKRTVSLYAEQRTLKVEPQQIIAMLGWQLHVLALVKTAGSSRNPETIAREAKLSPYVVKKTATIARGISFAHTRQLVSDLTTIDERLKQESLNADDALLEYLIRLSRDDTDDDS